MLKSQVRRLQRTGAVAAAAQKNMPISDSVLAHVLVQTSVVHSSRALQTWLDDRNFLIWKAWLAFTYQSNLNVLCAWSHRKSPGEIEQVHQPWWMTKEQKTISSQWCPLQTTQNCFSPKELRLGPFRSPCCALHFPLAGLEPPVKKPRELKVKSWHCIPSWSVCQQKSYDCDLGSGRLDARGKLPHDHSKYRRYRDGSLWNAYVESSKEVGKQSSELRMAFTWSRVVWGFASHNNTQNEGGCERTSHNNTLTESTSQSNTLNEGWCETLQHIAIHSMKGGVRLYITKQYTQCRVVRDCTSHNNTLNEGWCETYIT